VINKASHHEDVLWSAGIAPRILDLGTRWRCNEAIYDMLF